MHAEQTKRLAALDRPAAPALTPEVLERKERGERAIRNLEPLWHECLAFLDGEQFVERSAVSGNLVAVERFEGGSKPRWRPRTVRNRFTSAIVAEASIVTSRIPSYECVPLNGDPGPIAGARLAEKVLVSLHDTLNIGPRTLEATILAAATGAGFLWPHWDGLVGDPIPDPSDPSKVIARTGDIGIHVLGQDQVLWAPGVPFEQSRWYFVRCAQPVEHVKGRPDYMGPSDLKADARAAVPVGASRGHAEEREGLLFVYHYLERPSSKHPRGRWLQFAANQLIAPPDDYPRDRDEPCIHMLPWIPRPHRHRPMGIGEQLVDIQRTYNRTVNQIIAWKNLALAPQVLAPEGSLPRNQQLSDEPGAVFTYRPISGLKPEWRPVPEIPQSLFKTLDGCIADMEEITGQRELPKGIEAAAAIQAINERDASRRAMIIRNLAAFYSGLGKHLLALVQRHYTEERLLTVQGRFGVELIEGFLGAHVEGVLDVRVAEASIEPRTRASQEAKIMAFAERGWISPQQAMAALQGGTAEALIDEFELNVTKQHREIRQMVDVARAQPGSPLAMAAEPVPIPGPADNHQVHADVLRQWMLTRDFEMEPQEVQEAALLHLEMHEARIREAQEQQLVMQDAVAERIGRHNATRPAQASPLPSQPSLAANAAALGDPGPALAG